MGSIWLGAVTSLIGVIVGAGATYLTQEHLWKRGTRRELYASYVGQCNICLDRLLDVAYALRRNFSAHGTNERWEKANAQMAEVSSLAAQVSMVATARTRSAAGELEKHLFALKSDLHVLHTEGTTPQATSTYRDAYEAVVGDFIAAARRELGITRT